MSKNVLMIATIDGVENCAQVVEEQTGAKVEIARQRRFGMLALRKASYDVVVVEENLVEGDAEWADLLWASAGLAIPVQVNFARCGAARMAREVKAALQRRDGEHALARRTVAAEMENELKSSVTGLLLESELALREPAVSAQLEAKLRHLVELAGSLRERLRQHSAAA